MLSGKEQLLFLVIFTTGVLSIRSAMYSLGAVGGLLSVIGWGALFLIAYVLCCIRHPWSLN